MNTVCGAECESHRPSRAAESTNPLSPGGAAVARGYFHAVPPGRKTAVGLQTDWNRKFHLQMFVYAIALR